MPKHTHNCTTDWFPTLEPNTQLPSRHSGSSQRCYSNRCTLQLTTAWRRTHANSRNHASTITDCCATVSGTACSATVVGALVTVMLPSVALRSLAKICETARNAISLSEDTRRSTYPRQLIPIFSKPGCPIVFVAEACQKLKEFQVQPQTIVINIVIRRVNNQL